MKRRCKNNAALQRRRHCSGGAAKKMPAVEPLLKKWLHRSDELISWHEEEKNSEEKLSRGSSIHEK
jgi:hypothetical protein